MIGPLKHALALGMSLTLALPGRAALAWSDRLEGRPGNLEAGGDLGFYFWHEEHGLHVRTTGPGERHLFRAEIVTPGEIRNVHLVRLEGDDGYQVRDGGHRLDLRFETWAGVDGVDFTIEGGQFMTVTVRRDGDLIDTEEIFLGEQAVQPAHNPFGERR
jgi:hypothetical protein